MQQETTQNAAREAVGVFDNIHDLNEAVTELEVTAFPRHDISIRDGASHARHGNEDVVLARMTNMESEEDRADTPRTILIRPEEKVIGGSVITGGGVYAGVITGILIAGIEAPLSTIALTGLVGGAFGGVLGFVVAYLLGHYYNGILSKQIQEGRMFLWVRTPGSEEEKLACDIMKKHGGRRVHVHDVH